MSALHKPMKAEIEARLAAFHSATAAGSSEDAVYALLSLCASLARDTAQRSWTLRFEAEDRDDLMREDEDELVFICLQMPLSQIYPELPGQIEGVLRDAFDDEHFRLEDPEGWADINDEGQGDSEALQ